MTNQKIKTVNTLVSDIFAVLEGKGGWDDAISEFFAKELTSLLNDRLTQPQKQRNYLSLSGVGTPCVKQLWLRVNDPEEQFTNGQQIGNFLYGDIIELFVVSLIKAAGHRVEGLQEELEVFGIPGKNDIIVDGMLIDIKSASRFGFDKFKFHQLKEKDPYGYISQLSSYLYGYKDDPRVVYKDRAAFLAINKDVFDIKLDTYDLSEELLNKEKEITELKARIESPVVPDRLDDMPDGKSGNRKLVDTCVYCSRKKLCWPDVRAFEYSNGLTYLTKVRKLPRVPERKI